MADTADTATASAPTVPPSRPEQVRALDYARRRGTEGTLHEIRERVRGTYAAVEALVDSVPADLAARRPAVGAWSVHEVTDHLVESDRPAAEQLRRLLAGDSVDEPIPASLLSTDPHARSWDALRRELRDVHATLLALLDAADETASLEPTSTVVMVVRCADADGVLRPVHWLQRFDWKAFAILVHAHNREHLGQMQRTLAAVAPPLPASG